MKSACSVFVLSLVLSSTAFASTQSLFCTDNGAYRARIYLNYPAGTPGSFAKLIHAGSSQAMDFQCVLSSSVPGPVADQPFQVAFCNDGIGDGGYGISVRTGGYTGVTTATVMMKGIAYSKPIATLYCRSTSFAR